MKTSVLNLVALLLVILLHGLMGANCPVKCTCNPGTLKVTCDGELPQKLTDIPVNIPTYTQCLILDMYKLWTLRENSFANLTQLKFLRLRWDRIHFIKENAFFGLQNLELLDLSNNWLMSLNNSFTGTFNGAENLQVLILFRSRLKCIPDLVLAKLNKLLVLDLQRNWITNSTFVFGEGFRNLTKLRQLRLDVYNIGDLTNSTFSTLRHLKLMQLEMVIRGGTSHIDVGTFAGLTHLQEFNLTCPELDMSTTSIDLMLRQLCKAPVMRLGLSHINLKNISKTFQCFRQLTYLDISGNHIHTLENNTFINQNHLVFLNMADNHDPLGFGGIKFEPKALQGLTNLTVLNLRYTGAFPFWPSFADEQGHSFLPKIQVIDLSQNTLNEWWTDKVYERSPFVGLRQLKKLNMSHNNLENLTYDLLYPLERIEFLHLDNNYIQSIGKHTFSGLKNIKSLTLNSNRNWRVRQFCYFANLTSLEHLTLKGMYLSNDIGYADNFKPECLFQGLRKLEVLDLDSANFKWLHEQLFNDLTSLKSLILRKNQLSGWDEAALANLKNLRSLDISANKIHTINQSSLQPVSSTLNCFQAFSNPYICDCNLAWYADWVRQMHANKNFTLKISSTMPYNCSNIYKKSLLQYRPTFFECHRLPIILSASGVGLFIVTLAVISLVYKYRWYLRYWIFLLRTRRKRHMEEADRLLYTYDCFITYSGEDSDLVTQHLLPKLENEFGFKLCIHERDFRLGCDISENITESIEKSRKVLVVLTNNFVQSKWCKFEVNLAHAKMLHNAQKARQSLILLLVEDVGFENMTPILRYLVRKKTYLEWSTEVRGQRVFWERLKDAIQQRGQDANLDDD